MSLSNWKCTNARRGTKSRQWKSAKNRRSFTVRCVENGTRFIYNKLVVRKQIQFADSLLTRSDFSFIRREFSFTWMDSISMTSNEAQINRLQNTGKYKHLYVHNIRSTFRTKELQINYFDYVELVPFRLERAVDPAVQIPKAPAYPLTTFDRWKFPLPSIPLSTSPRKETKIQRSVEALERRLKADFDPGWCGRGASLSEKVFHLPRPLPLPLLLHYRALSFRHYVSPVAVRTRNA